MCLMCILVIYEMSSLIITPCCKVFPVSVIISWLVIGERKDKHMYDTDWTDENGRVIVEPLKSSEE